MATTVHKFALPNHLIQLSSNDWKNELAQLRRVWETGKKDLYITGHADCGKTDLAINFGLQICPGNTYFVRYDRTLRATIADMPLSGYIQMPDDWSLSEEKYEQQRCQEKLQILWHYYSDALFIIDGVDAQTICQETEYAQLMEMGARFIFTSRNRCDDEAIFLFRKTGFTQSLLEGIERLTAVQRNVLCCIALVSNYGLQLDTFLHCLSADKKRAVNILRDKNLIAIRSDSAVTIRPDLREHYIRILRPTDADCANFLNKLAWFITSGTCNSSAEYRQIAHFFANSSKQLRDQSGLCARYAAQMFRDSGDYISCFPFLEAWLACQLDLQPRDELDLARALCETGAANWFQALSSTEMERKQALKTQAAKRIKEGVLLHEQNLNQGDPDYAEAHMGLAAILGEQDWAAGNEYIKETMDNQLEALSDNDSALCVIYLNYAMSHYQWSKRHLRREYAEKALKIMERQNHVHKDMALACEILSECAQSGEKRLAYAMKALELYCQQTPWKQYSIYKCMLRVAKLNQRLGEYAAQKEYLMQAGKVLEGILPPGHPRLLAHYNEME